MLCIVVIGIVISKTIRYDNSNMTKLKNPDIIEDENNYVFFKIDILVIW